ncbi:MAG: chromate transporter [Anaerolineales bacterium]|nr:chromate transporter [Anaerolineales bacterium]
MSLLSFILLIFTFNLLTFGNGPAMIPMLQADLVDHAQVLSIEQLLYAFAIARVTPGQANVYVASIGYFLFGLSGAFLATLAIQLPGYIMLPFMRTYERMRSNAWVGRFTRGLTVASVGLIFAATFSIGIKTLGEPVTWIVFIVTLLTIVLLKWNQMLGLLLASLLGILLKLLL